MEQYMPMIWVGFAILMLMCEGLTSQLVSIWFVLGAACAAVTTAFTSDITIQSAVFLGVSLISLLVTRPLVKKLKRKTPQNATNAERLIGMSGVMLEDLFDITETAQAKVSGEVWTVKTDEIPLAEGERVKVLGIEGVKLVVKRDDDNSQSVI